MVMHGRVIQNHPVGVDYQASGRSAGVFAVRDDVGDRLAEDLVAQADPHVAFEIEGVVQVLFDKPHHQVVGVNQVGADDEPVVVALGVLAAEQAVELVGGHRLLDHQVGAEHQHGGQGQAGFAGFPVNGVEPADFQQFFVT